MEQSWVMNNLARSQPSEAMADAVDNRKRIMGSSIFGGNDRSRYPPPQQQQYYASPQSTQQLPSQTMTSTFPSNYASTAPSPVVYSTQPLTSIPDFITGDCPPPPIDSLSFKGRSSQLRQTGNKRLEVHQNHELQKLRDSLVSDSTAMSRRLRQIGKD